MRIWGRKERGREACIRVKPSLHISKKKEKKNQIRLRKNKLTEKGKICLVTVTQKGERVYPYDNADGARVNVTWPRCQAYDNTSWE